MIIDYSKADSTYSVNIQNYTGVSGMEVGERVRDAG